MESIENQFLCIICLQILNQPIYHPACGKYFCKPCADQFLASSQNPACPNCRGHLTRQDLIVDHRMRNEIQNKVFNCPCGRPVPYSELNSHSASCPSLRTDIKAAVVKPKTNVVNRWTYNCPNCQLKNLDRAALVKHFRDNHRGCSGVCPICKVMPWGDANYVSHDLSGHLSMRHKMDYEELTVNFM